MMFRDFSEYNESSWFLYPLLEIPKKYDFYLYNTYLNNKSYPDLTNCLYCIYKITEDNEEMLDELIINKEYFSNYNINEHFRCVIFTIPEKYNREYSKFLNSKYSEFGDYSKILIKTRFNIRDIHEILDKAKSMKMKWEKTFDIDIGDQEVWKAIDMNKETFNELEFVNRIKSNNNNLQIIYNNNNNHDN